MVNKTHEWGFWTFLQPHIVNPFQNFLKKYIKDPVPWILNPCSSRLVTYLATSILSESLDPGEVRSGSGVGSRDTEEDEAGTDWV